MTAYQKRKTPHWKIKTLHRRSQAWSETTTQKPLAHFTKSFLFHYDYISAHWLNLNTLAYSFRRRTSALCERARPCREGEGRDRERAVRGARPGARTEPTDFLIAVFFSFFFYSSLAFYTRKIKLYSGNWIFKTCFKFAL